MKNLRRHVFLLSIVLVFFGINAFPQCNAPTLQPTNLILTSTTNSVSGIFNAAMDADHYLIVRSTMSTLNSTPVNGTTYAVSNSLGGGTVAAYQTDTIISDTNLYAGTQYFYFVFAATSLSCSGGPAYLITSPLIGTITCPLKSLNITAILQEYYNTSTDLMNQTLGINWDTGDLFHNFGSTIVDTVTVFIRSTRYPNYVIEATYNGVNLNTNGSIQTIYLNSNWNACPYGEITGYHHIVIKHRNSIETWSDSVDFSVQQINYNFFTHTPVEFAGGMYEDGNGNFEIWGGDVNQNGNLESEDCTLIYVAANSDDETVNNGYVICDIDGNGNIDTQDYGLAYNNANLGANTINFLVYPTQPSGLTLTPNYSTVTGTFSATETADHYLIVRSTNSTLSALPVKGTIYTAGNTIGGGVVVSYQIGTSFTDTSLNSGTHYYYIFASDTLYCTHSYLTTSPLTNNVFINCGIPLAQPTVLTLSNNGNSISGSFTASASADHYLIVRSTIDPLTAIPVNGTTYIAGNQLGGGIVLAYQTGTSFIDSNLNMCTQYHYYVLAANCTGSPQYLTTNSLTNNIEIPYNNAITLSSSDTTIQLSANDTVVWYLYHASNTHLSIKEAFLLGPPIEPFLKIYIYSGNCENFAVVDTTYNPYKGLYIDTLTIGNNYYIKITKPYLAPSIYLQLNNSYNVILNCYDWTCYDNIPPVNQSPGYSYDCDYVCNGDFENHTNPPEGISQIGLCCPWGAINDATSDYFNGDAIDLGYWNVSVPNNFGGYKEDYYSSSNHKGYAGILYTNFCYAEYIFQKLKNPLLTGFNYNVSLKVCRPQYCGKALDNFGVTFNEYNMYIGSDANVPDQYYKKSYSNYQPCPYGSTGNIDYIPDQTWIWNIPHPGTHIESTDWYDISFNFTPTVGMGALQYIIIGYFGPADIIDEPVPNINIPDWIRNEPYLYIDEVHIVPIPTTVTINGSVNCINNLTGIFSLDIPTDPAPPTGTIWQWTVPTGATITSGNGTSSITVDWGSTGSGDVTVVGQYLGCTIYTGILPVDIPDCSVDAQYIADANMNTNTSSYFLATYGTGSIFTTNDKIYINGIFTIDQNISFDGCPNIVMGPNAKIVVNQNRYISITNSHIYGCECLWDGIYVQDPTELVILSNTIVQDAKNAVVSINDGNFHICCNTVFVNNIIGIWVKDYNSESNSTAIPHQGYVSSTYFEYNSSIPMFYDYSQNMIGVLVNEVYQLTIGDKTHPLLTNFFRNLKYGIKTTDSDVNIYNNNFDHIGITSSNPPSYSGSYTKPDEAAIFSAKRTYIHYGRPPYLYFTNQINIGDNSGTIQNEFSECNIGVFGLNIKPDIENNLFKLQRYTGIHLKDCKDGVTIRNNVFEMHEDYWALNNLYNSTMIVEFPTASLTNALDIYDNTINETRTGINLSNCGNISTTCNIHDNFINFGTVKIKLNYIGIKSKSGSYENIINNSISYGSTPTINNQSSLRGIELQSVTNSYIRRNNMNSLGTGMSVTGTSTATQFWCNHFNSCWYGICLFGVISSQTYPGNEATDNFWIDLDYPNSYDYRVTGQYLISGQSIYWRHQGITNIGNNYSPYIVYPDNPLYSSIIAFQNSAEGNACGSNKSSTSIAPTDRTDLLQNIVLDSLVYDTLSAENKYFAKTFTYRLLDDNPAYLNLGTTDDSIYQNFYDTTKVTNIGKLYEVDKLILNIDYDKADSLNSLLTGINLIETNQIEVNRIYLTKLLFDTISSVDSLSLVNIAYQSTFTGGKGVYGARVILGIDIDTLDNILPKSLIHQDINKKMTGTSDIKVYPNPANNMLYIEFDNMTDGIAKVEFFDMTGKLHYSTSINTTLKLQTLNISSIKVGIYYLRISTTTKINNQKLVIIK
ncbi:MAG: T9SS type A sorting domain-containing protein [Bacteroidota bacterium]